MVESFTGLRVLVVDDDNMVGETLVDQLVQLGFTTVGLAANCEIAVHAITDVPPSCVILDVHLRDRSCLSVARLLRERRIPFVFSTGGIDEEIREEFPTVPLLAKPYSTRKLESAMLDLLEQG